jgi:hypothetical protein
MKTYDKSHLQFEISCWDRLLKCIELNNVYFKNRLAELIGQCKPNELDTLEQFLNLFITKDNLISILRNEVALQLKAMMTNETITIEEIEHHFNFRKDIIFFKNSFEKMNTDFIEYSTSQIY